MSTSDILESLIEKDNGYLITSKAVESGVSKPSVSKYVREHDMEKVAVERAEENIRCNLEEYLEKGVVK